LKIKQKYSFYIILIMLSLLGLSKSFAQNLVSFQFFNQTFNLSFDSGMQIPFSGEITEPKIQEFYKSLNQGNYQPILNNLLAYKESHHLDDWFYYQLIRKTVQQISPKEDNYERYTLYKWFLLGKSGYDTQLAIGPNQLLFYVYSNDDVSDIPFITLNERTYVCLNNHDYVYANYQKDLIYPVSFRACNNNQLFSYKVTQIPDFNSSDYQEKTIAFNYKEKAYNFDVKMNTDVQSLFKNYPIVDFESYFNIPLSRETYSSLIPALKNNLKGLNQKKGVDYLMKFTRYAFKYESDEDNFGKEKRLSPEQTLFSDYSDCDDRAALFFYLVKEIYNLPMIALLYPSHITMAVKFDKSNMKNGIEYKGDDYYVCEPTPQKKNLKIGQLDASLAHLNYQVVYQYLPNNK
jgi:hypothetical protein